MVNDYTLIALGWALSFQLSHPLLSTPPSLPQFLFLSPSLQEDLCKTAAAIFLLEKRTVFRLCHVCTLRINEGRFKY